MYMYVHGCMYISHALSHTQGLKFKHFPYLLTMQLKRFDFDHTSFHRIKLNDKWVWLGIVGVAWYSRCGLMLWVWLGVVGVAFSSGCGLNQCVCVCVKLSPVPSRMTFPHVLDLNRFVAPEHMVRRGWCGEMHVTLHEHVHVWCM